ncbi:phosphonate transport system substrate-binding protein [Advenella incenata]|jgi:phosphonate transport system substrate-binding protein|uniref:Phosphonate transport system substrate-binding protein n=1 Tax=Advenella incenata TaxID=267800 RepID=A0A4Q7VR79_9BURK|nr:phosphonate ABC transporter substrate-binding protein [Advenella incenata]RZT99003.1 phosphonate transport system substrate-binding protein [Advenella incenata]
MFKSTIRRLGISLFALGMSAAAVQAQESKELNFGIISTESSQNLKTVWEPFLADLSKQTGYKVKAFFAPDYAGIIQGMRFDKVDIAWYGNKSAMEAVDRANGEVIYQTVDKDGKPGYWSLLIAHKDSKINSVKDMLDNAKTLNFSNGDPNSTSGYLVPGYYVFAENNVDANKIFKRSVNGSHEVNALSVANKQVDVATFNTEGMERLQKTNPAKVAELKVIWKSPLIPADPIVWRKNLPEDAKTKLKTFFDNYGDKPEELKVLNALAWGKFKPSSNDQLLPIRQLELFKKRSQIAGDSKLDEQDRKKQIASLDEELSKISVRMKAIEGKNS